LWQVRFGRQKKKHCGKDKALWSAKLGCYWALQDVEPTFADAPLPISQRFKQIVIKNKERKKKLKEIIIKLIEKIESDKVKKKRERVSN